MLTKPDSEFIERGLTGLLSPWTSKKDDLPILDLGGRRSSSPSFSWTRCQEYTMGSVPEDDSHCKVRSLPSVSSPSNSHLGFDGLTGKKKKRSQRSPDTREQYPVDLFFLIWSTFECEFNSPLLPRHALHLTPQNIPTSIPCTHTHPIPAVSSGADVI